MMRKLFPALAALALTACESGSTSDAPAYPVPAVVPTGDVVAVVGPTTITTDELVERIKMQNPLVRTRLGDPKELERFVASEVRNELLAQVGWERGLFDDPEVQRALRQAVVRKLMSREVSGLDKEIEITDAEIVALYKERESQYFRPERVRIGKLFLPADTPAKKTKVKARLERLADQIRKRQRQGRRNAFDEVAREVTAETGVDRRSVDLGFLTREDAEEKLGAEPVAAIFDDMTVGDVTVAVLEDGVAILAKSGRRGEVRRSLESVKPSLVAQLRANKRGEMVEARIDELAAERNISLELKNLDKMEFGQVPAETEKAPER